MRPEWELWASSDALYTFSLNYQCAMLLLVLWEYLVVSIWNACRCSTTFVCLYFEIGVSYSMNSNTGVSHFKQSSRADEHAECSEQSCRLYPRSPAYSNSSGQPPRLNSLHLPYPKNKKSQQQQQIRKNNIYLWTMQSKPKKIITESGFEPEADPFRSSQ